MSKRNKRREPIEISIDGLSHEGRGVGRIDGKTVFVHGALPGERVLARVIRRRGSFDEAETLEVIEPSPKRIEPACPHFGVCGGCSLQHMDEDYQIAHKQGVLLELLEHHANCQPEVVAPAIRGPQWGYRRKARIGAKLVPKKGGVIVGFRERGKPYLTDSTRCDILDPRLGEQLPALRALIQSLSVAARLPQVEVAIGDEVVALVFRHLDPLNDEDRALMAQFAADTGFEIYLQSGGLETVTPLTEPARPLTYSLDGMDLQFQATDFTQVNATINQRMLERALQWLELSAEDTVMDLFCGIGNFTLPMARRAGRVVGLEGDQALVDRAADNALSQNIENCEFKAVDLADPEALSALDLSDFNKLLLDPPRAGALEMLTALNLKNITRLVYVSCNAVTFARDTAELQQRHGFTLTECGVLDMFPQTAHFESIAVFDRR